MPAEVREPEVRDVIQAARQNVQQKPRAADAWGLLGMTLLTHLFDRDADRCFAEAARLDPKDAALALRPRPDRPEARPDRALGYLRRRPTTRPRRKTNRATGCSWRKRCWSASSWTKRKGCSSRRFVGGRTMRGPPTAWA